MCKTSLLAIVILCSSALAQVPALDQPLDGDEYGSKMDSIFMNLNKSPSRIPTGLLYEKGYNLVDVKLLQGQVANKPITFQTWKMLYFSFFTAGVNKKNTITKSLENIEQLVGNAPKAQIQLPILHIGYNTIERHHALQAGWLQIVNEQLFDTPIGLLKNPYDTKIGFAVAPTQDEITTTTTEFFLNPQLFINNTSLSITKIDIDFDNRTGYKTYYLGDKPSITWQNFEPKNIKFKVFFSNGSIKYANSTMKINISQASLRYNTEIPDFQEVIGIAGQNVGGTISVSYADANRAQQMALPQAQRKLKKPFIVLGGIDPTNEYGYEQFMRGMRRNTFNFIDSLSLAAASGDYDLIFLDYEDGGASILKNSRLFQLAVEWVNNRKIADPITGIKEQNVVMGMSMGGLVARYGLAQMEKGLSPNGYNAHDTRLLITHDSPHQGSNVPAGIQYLGRKVVNDAILRLFMQPVRDLAKLADSPASKEMQIYRTERRPISVNPLNPGFNPAAYTVFGSVDFHRNTFLANIYHPMVDVSPSFNPSYRFIATSQGSECGLGIVAPGGTLIHSDGGVGVGVPWYFSNTLGYSFNLDAGQNTSQEILNFRVYNRTVLFDWFLGGITIDLGIKLLKLNNPYPDLSSDGLPGGITKLDEVNNTLGPNAVNNNVLDLILINFTVGGTLFVAPGFCFIPRYSALDIPIATANNLPNITLAGGYSNISRYNPTRTNSFITQEVVPSVLNPRAATNLEHLTFTQRQTAWLFEEMQRKTPAIRGNCAVNCDVFGGGGFPINGDAPAFSTIYSPDVTYTWSISGVGASIVGANNTHNARIITPPTPGIFYTLTLTVTTNCWARSTYKNITCSIPESRYSDPFLQTYHNGTNGYYDYYSCLQDFTQVQSCLALELFDVTTVSVNGNSYAVPITNPTIGQPIVSTPYYIISGSQTAVSVLFIDFGNYTTEAFNPCGTVPIYYTTIWPDTSGVCRVVAPTPKSSTTNFTISPNPSSENEITISKKLSEQSDAKNEEFTLVLYNKLQIKVRETTLNTLSKTISTEGLPNDVYFLHIISKDGDKVVKQVMIMR